MCMHASMPPVLTALMPGGGSSKRSWNCAWMALMAADEVMAAQLRSCATPGAAFVCVQQCVQRAAGWSLKRACYFLRWGWRVRNGGWRSCQESQESQLERVGRSRWQAEMLQVCEYVAATVTAGASREQCALRGAAWAVLKLAVGAARAGRRRRPGASPRRLSQAAASNPRLVSPAASDLMASFNVPAWLAEYARAATAQQQQHVTLSRPQQVACWSRASSTEGSGIAFGDTSGMLSRAPQARAFAPNAVCPCPAMQASCATRRRRCQQTSTPASTMATPPRTTAHVRPWRCWLGSMATAHLPPHTQPHRTAC